MEILKENMAQDLTRPSPTPFTRIYRHLSLQMPSDFGRRRFNQGRGRFRHHNSVMAVGSNVILRWLTQNVGLPIIENLWVLQPGQ